jgi:hypothetical protein
VECENTDNGARDRIGNPCSRYVESNCGRYDDVDFSSNTMCCICEGGSSAQSGEIPESNIRPGLDRNKTCKIEKN